MQDWPLLCHNIIDHAAIAAPDRAVVSRSVEGPIVRTNYTQIHSRARRVAKALQRRGIRLGDRVGTLAWNTARHVEAWYGIMGLGAICHTINPRLFPEQITYITNHAEDRIIYDASNGALYFDADGSGGAANAVRFATLAPHLSVHAGDFLVV